MTVPGSVEGAYVHSTATAPPESSHESMWPALESSRSGKSSRQWEPRVSVRSAAASASAVLIVCRLVVSQAGVPGVASPGSRARRKASASARPSAWRSTPTRVVITSCMPRRRSPAISPSGRSSAAGSAHARSSPGSTSAIRREKTRPSSSELEASRLAPWTPEHATSPVAYSPGTDERPHRSVATPPEA